MDGHGRGESAADADGNPTPPAGPLADARALATQVKPPFMAPAVGTALFGALLAPTLAAPLAGALHVACVALAVYVAHLRDERVDAYVRGEEAPSVPAGPLRAATVAGTVAFLAALAGVWLLAGPLAAALTLPPLALALLHAPYLDTNPVTVSADYPVAIAFVVAGGYATQTGAVPPRVAWLAASFVPLLAGTTVALDRLDRAFDASVDKRTVPVVVGDARAASVSAALVAGGAAVVVAGALAGLVPQAAVLATPIPLAAALITRRADAQRAVQVQMAAAYPFAAALFLAACLGGGCVIADTVGGLAGVR